jgi:uncharacterized protein (DUF2164 family)
MNWTNRQLLQKLQQFKKKEITNKKVVIPAELVLDLIGERKSRYYYNPVKKLSFPRKRESRGSIYKACLQLDSEAEIRKKTR